MRVIKRIFAFIAAILLLLLPLVLIISAFLATKESHSLFVASLFSIVIIPIFLYAYILIHKIINKDKDNHSQNDTTKE